MATGKKLDDLHVNNQIQVHNGGTITNANTDFNITATNDDLLLNAQDDVFIQSNGGSSYKTITFANDGNTTFPGSIFLPQGAYDYHNNIPSFSQSGVSSYSASRNVAYVENTLDTPGKGEKVICETAARAYTNYVHLKTNLTSNNVMFYFRTRGYVYNAGVEEHLFGGYTYNGTIIATNHETVAGGTQSLGAYRGSSGHLCLRIHVNTTGYNEGRLHVLFGSHSNTVTRNLEVTDVRQRDDGSNAF